MFESYLKIKGHSYKTGLHFFNQYREKLMYGRSKTIITGNSK